MRDCDIELLRKSSPALLVTRRGMVKEAKRIVVKQRQGDNLDQSTISASQRLLRTVQKKP
jgi:hypothetical protein